MQLAFCHYLFYGKHTPYLRLLDLIRERTTIYQEQIEQTFYYVWIDLEEMSRRFIQTALQLLRSIFVIDQFDLKYL